MRLARNVLSLAAAAALCPAMALGQARTKYNWNKPRLQGISSVGGEVGRYSTGLGDLRGYSAPSGGNLLRTGISSNISSMSGYKLAPVRSPSAGTTNVTPTIGRVTGRTYGAVRLNLSALASAAPYQVGPPELGTAGSGLAGYLDSMGYSSELSAEQSRPLKSFVPTEPSVYRRKMAEGERLFRRGEYRDAHETLGIALAITRQPPEVHLSRVHTGFALQDYYTAVNHLRQALTLFPELPLVNMSIRDFYGQPDGFDDHAGWLDKRVDKQPETGGDMWLLWAYIRYFNGEPDEAASALEWGYVLSKRAKHKDKETGEAIKIFWDGMVAAGKASGDEPPPRNVPPTIAPAKKASSAAPAEDAESGQDAASKPAGGSGPAATERPSP